MKNIELKVKVDCLDGVREKLVQIQANKEGDMYQLDTYFNSEKGRLKLREIDNENFVLIYYERPNEVESKVSTYELVEFDKEGACGIKSVLQSTNGIKVVVEKKRELWIYKNTRIHLDNVNDLGEYLELETVVKDISMAEAEVEHKEIICLLELDQYQKCDVSYSDLLM